MHPLDRLLRPSSLALVGASDQAASLGTAFTRQVLDSGFAGELHLVNRQRREVFGRPTLEHVEQLPDGLDLALLMTPWTAVPEIVEQLARRGCAGVVIIGVASESGWPWASRKTLLDRLRRKVARHGMRVIGPASQGLTLAHMGLNLSLCPALPPPGGIGFVGHAGAVAGVIADWSARRGIGMSALLSLGDALDVDIADCLDWFANDQGTRAVLVHLEQLGAARKLLSAARALSFRKPLVLLKAREASHAPDDPAARASDEVHANAFRRAGILQVHDLEEFCAAANVDLPTWPHAGSRFAIVGNGSALGALAADAVHAHGGQLAQPGAETLRRLRALLPPRSQVGNPLDLQRDADAARYCGSVRTLAADPGVDVLLLLHHPTSFSEGREIAAALEPVQHDEALVLAAFAGAEQQQARRILAERGIAAFPTPEAAVRAYRLNRRHHRLRSELMETAPPLMRWPLIDRESVLGVVESLRKDPARLLPALLAELGIDLRPDPARSRQFPALGLRAHPLLGPYAIARSADAEHVELLPLDRLRIERLCRIGWRQVEMAEDLRSTLQGQLLQLAELATLLPSLHRLELEGIGLDNDGGTLAHVAFDWSDAEARVEPAFAPYPAELAETLELRDGRRLLLRPIRAEDEPALQRGFTRLSPEEVRMRFLYPLNALTHDLAARLTQLDYDRELALVLADFQPPGQAELHAVVRASYDRARASAEFAIVILRELAGQGLGLRLLSILMRHCHAAGMRQIQGDTLSENAPMRALARKLGFQESLRDGLIHLRRDLP